MQGVSGFTGPKSRLEDHLGEWAQETSAAKVLDVTMQTSHRWSFFDEGQLNPSSNRYEITLHPETRKVYYKVFSTRADRNDGFLQSFVESLPRNMSMSNIDQLQVTLCIRARAIHDAYKAIGFSAPIDIR